MRPSALIDLHCDTLTNWADAPAPFPDTLDTLNDPARALSLSGLPRGVCWGQFFAVFIPDEKRGQAAIDYFDRNLRSFRRQMEQFSGLVAPCRGCGDMERAFAAGKTAAFLTVENGSVLAGDLTRVAVLKQAGVCALTLVWNGENELGSGSDTDHGLSDFGRRAVPALEEAGILADVSHLNDRGFYECLEVAKRPFLATHSNARAVAGHRRNLTDDMIRIMAQRGCLVGLNYAAVFLQDGGRVSGLDIPYRHVMRFLELGADGCLALGSDFDGADLAHCLNSPQKTVEFFDYLLSRNLPQAVVEGIFYRNAWDFFRKYLP